LSAENRSSPGNFGFHRHLWSSRLFPWRLALAGTLV
jgi:hypothetical protein